MLKRLLLQWLQPEINKLIANQTAPLQKEITRLSDEAHRMNDDLNEIIKSIMKNITAKNNPPKAE
jgi:hypothetical protein